MDCEEFKCGECQHKTQNKDELHMHMKSEHPNNTLYDAEKDFFKCDQCDYEIGLELSLNLHRATVHNIEVVEWRN